MFENYKINDDFDNTRLDKWLRKEIIDIPQSLIEKLIRKNKIKVNGKKTKSSYRIKKGDLIEFSNIKQIQLKKKENKKILYKSTNKEKKSYDNFIIEDNENFLVINKPAGIAVQSGTKSFKNIIDILKDTKYFLNSKPYIVHRIDKETSGVLIIAKNRKYAQLFTSLFRIRKIHKTYLAIVYGRLSEKIKKLENDLITYDNKKKNIQKAITNIKIIKSNDNFSLLELNPITGRKHQLRKQLSFIEKPIIGDNKYNIRRIKSKLSLKLHAFKIKFMINDKKYNFKANYNEDFNSFLKKNF